MGKHQIFYILPYAEPLLHLFCPGAYLKGVINPGKYYTIFA